MIKKAVILFAIMMFVSQNSEAEVFKFFGARPAGMGGAYVAVAEGTLAQYWNPAGLGLKESKFDLRVPVGLSVEATKNLLESVEDLSDLATGIEDIQNKSGSDSMNLDSYKNFAEALNKINALNEPGMGILADIRGGVGVQFWKMALSVNNYTEFSADPFVDLSNISLIDTGSIDGIDAVDTAGINTADPVSVSTSTRDDLAGVIDDLVTRLDLELPAGISTTEAANAVINEAVASGSDTAAITNTISDMKSDYDEVTSSLPAAGGGSFDDNTTNLTIRGASITEVALGAGGSFPFQKDIPVLSNVIVGGNLKMFQGKVAYAQINALEESAGLQDIADSAIKNTKDSTKFSLDLGILYDRKEDWKFRTGIVLRNLTGPSFEGPTDNTTTAVVEGDGINFDMSPQVRGGVAFWPFKRWVFAADIDFTENDTILENYKSRLVSLGTEFKLINSKMIDLALRAGLYKNIAETESALAYTAGLGLTLLHVNLDLSGAISSKTVEIEGGDSIPASASVSLALSMLF